MAKTGIEIRTTDASGGLMALTVSCVIIGLSGTKLSGIDVGEIFKAGSDCGEPKIGMTLLIVRQINQAAI